MGKILCIVAMELDLVADRIRSVGLVTFDRLVFGLELLMAERALKLVGFVEPLALVEWALEVGEQVLFLGHFRLELEAEVHFVAVGGEFAERGTKITIFNIILKNLRSSPEITCTFGVASKPEFGMEFGKLLYGS
jgi:hypothetical protein